VEVIGSGCGGSSILNTCMPNIVAGQTGRQNSYGKTPGGTKANWDPSSANYIGNVQYVNPLAFDVNVAGTTGSSGNYGTYSGASTEAVGGEAYSVGVGPADYVPGNAPRVAPLGMFGQHWVNLDMALRRTFPIYHEWKAQFELDMANVANHVVYGLPGQVTTNPDSHTTVQSGVTNGVVNPTFGTISQVDNTPREVQGSLRISF
jgi:hypothetical protein